LPNPSPPGTSTPSIEPDTCDRAGVRQAQARRAVKPTMISLRVSATPPQATIRSTTTTWAQDPTPLWWLVFGRRSVARSAANCCGSTARYCHRSTPSIAAEPGRHASPTSGDLHHFGPAQPAITAVCEVALAPLRSDPPQFRPLGDTCVLKIVSVGVRHVLLPTADPERVFDSPPEASPAVEPIVKGPRRRILGRFRRYDLPRERTGRARVKGSSSTGKGR
jgi:hypothetical protein